jgi:inhibitor of KinA sporulation pathway (predicted exonuclease)
VSDVIPGRGWWVKKKKEYNVPDGAVRGINIGELLEKYSNGKTIPERAASAAKLEKAAAAYITKIDKKKVKNFAAFEKVFLDEIVHPAHAQVQRSKLAADGKALYQVTLQKWFAAVQALDPAKAKAIDLQAFVKYSRGVSSAGLRTNGAVDTKAINDIMKNIDELNDNTDYKNLTPDDAAVFIGVVKKVANGVRVAAKKQDLVK